MLFLWTHIFINLIIIIIILAANIQFLFQLCKENCKNMQIWLLITDCWLLIIDCLHTDDTEKHGCPQMDLFCGNSNLFTHCQSQEEFIKLKQVSAIGQQLKKIGPQADGVGVNANFRELSVNLSWINIFVGTTEGDDPPSAGGGLPACRWLMNDDWLMIIDWWLMYIVSFAMWLNLFFPNMPRGYRWWRWWGCHRQRWRHAGDRNSGLPCLQCPWKCRLWHGL